MRLGGPQGRSGRAENLVLTGIRSRPVQLSYPAHCFIGNGTKSKVSLRICIQIFLLAVFGVFYVYDVTGLKQKVYCCSLHWVEALTQYGSEDHIIKMNL